MFSSLSFPVKILILWHQTPTVDVRLRENSQSNISCVSFERRDQTTPGLGGLSAVSFSRHRIQVSKISSPKSPVAPVESFLQVSTSSYSDGRAGRLGEGTRVRRRIKKQRKVGHTTTGVRMSEKDTLFFSVF